MDNYTKGTVAEYSERNRKSLVELFNDISEAAMNLPACIVQIFPNVVNDHPNEEIG